VDQLAGALFSNPLEGEKLMSRWLLGAAACLMVAANVREDEKVHLPTSPQPLQVVAQLDKDGNILIHQTLPELRTETLERLVNKDGRQVKETYTVTKIVHVPVIHKLAAKTVQVYRADGKMVDPKALPKLLKKPTTVLVTIDGQMADPFYLQILKEGTLILVPPAVKVLPAPEVKPAEPLKKPSEGR
jgi:hypothetical protein